MDKVLVFDITSTGAMIGVVDEDGTLLFGKKFDFSIEDVKTSLAKCKKEALVFLEENGMSLEDDITHIAACIGAYINHESGVVSYIPLLGAKDQIHIDLKKDMQKAFNKENCYVLNDALAGAIGEYWLGSGVQYDSVLFYKLDSSVDGAIIQNGQVIMGSRSIAGKFGHGVNVCDIDTECYCGLRGCLSALCSENGIKDYVKRKITQEQPDPAAFYFSDIDLDKLDTSVIYDVYMRNNKPLEVFDLIKRAMHPVLKHMAILNNAFDPDAIIFSGSIARLDDFLIQIIREALIEDSLEYFTDGNVVEQAILGPDAAMYGAAYYALNDGDLSQLS